MLVPISWIKEYTDIPEDINEFAAKMVMSGSNIETVTTFGGDISKVVIGRIAEVEKHPDSDHLLVCLVDVGEASESGGPIQVVTGAQNVREGALVPVALHGSQLPGGVKIKKGKLRGIESHGMICSASELGFDDKVSPMRHKDGIWLLPDEFEVGQDVVEAMGLDETVVDFEITPNRPDCLSILGMAREAAATFGTGLRYPSTASGEGNPAKDGRAATDFIKVGIGKPELCRRYVARIAEDIQVKESPWWLQRRLMFAGMRPISNIVDITNYVMLEYGHPIHAFDIRAIAGETIKVDTADEGSKFTTLDGVERTMAGDMLLINDAEKGVAVAGVMGGLNSEIEPDTERILIEAASFLPSSVRLTAKRLGIRSEASSRFEKGVPAELSGVAADRVCSLIADTGAGNVVCGAADCYPAKAKPAHIKVRPTRMNAILGTDMGKGEMKAILQRLEILVEDDPKDENAFWATPPFIRVDLKEEIDYSEEIGRLYGFDNLGMTIHRDSADASRPLSWALRDKLRDILTGMGLSEIQTYSFVSPGGVDAVEFQGSGYARDFVKLLNPLGEENSVMRTFLLPSMMSTLARNNNYSITEVGAFEIGNTFREVEGEGLPEERLSLCIGAYGAQWDFFKLKGLIEGALKGVGVAETGFATDTDTGSWHPGRCAKMSVGHSDLGWMGQIHPDVAEAFGIDGAVYAAVLDLETLFKAADMEKPYKPLPKFPAAQRDISLLTGEDVAVGEITALIRANGGGILESAELFDVYRGKQIPEGMKSLSFSLVYRDPGKTLTDDEVNAVHERMLALLKEKTGAALRDV